MSSYEVPNQRIWVEGFKRPLRLVDLIPRVAVGWRPIKDVRYFYFFDTRTKECLGIYWYTLSDLRQLSEEEVVMLELSFLKKAKAKADASDGQWEMTDPAWAGKYPHLAVFMWANLDEDGEPRQRSALKIMVESGQWKACLIDAQTRKSLWVTLKAPEEAFKALDKALAANEPDWRFWKNDGKPEGKKRGWTGK